MTATDYKIAQSTHPPGPVPIVWAGGTEGRTERLPYLQAIRGVAAMAVVVHHVLKSRLVPGDAFGDLHLGQAGVLLFFVLSGFIIAHTARDEPASNFARRRIIRVVPLYWLVTLVYAAILFRSDIARSGGISFERLGDLGASLLFVPHFHFRMTENVWPVLVQGWTLNFEMFFFFVFGLGLALGHARVVAVGLLLWLVLLGAVTAPDDPRILVWTSPLLLLFVAGIVLSWMHDIGWLTRSFAALPVGAILLVIGAVVSLPPGARDLVLGTGAILALGGTLAWQARRPGVGIPGLDTLGDASYAIYLSHTVVLIPLGLVLPMLGLPLPITVIVAIIICAIAGWLLHVTVERPMTIALRQRFDRAANKGTS